MSQLSVDTGTDQELLKVCEYLDPDTFNMVQLFSSVSKV